MIENTRRERERLSTRANILFQIYQDLGRARVLCEESAATIERGAALNKLALAMEIFIKTQVGQAESNLREMKELLETYDEALRKAGSSIIEAHGVIPRNSPSTGGRR